MNTNDKESIISLLLHDLRPPLQVLRFLTGHLSDSAAGMNPGQLAGYLKELNIAVGDLVQSSSAIFTWLEVQRAQFYEGPRPVLVRSFLESVQQQFAQDLPDAAPHVVIGSAPETEACFDSRAAATVLYQLLRNAAGQKADIIQLDAYLEQDSLRLSVTDSGPGMSGRVIESINAHLGGDNHAPVLYRYGYRIIVQVLQSLNGTISFKPAAEKHEVSIRIPVQHSGATDS